MVDYEARYRALKVAGFKGWAGLQYDRGLASLTETLDRLTSDGSLPPPPACLLELGCGNGVGAALMAAKGYGVEGIDLSQTAIAWAAEYFAEADLAGRFHQGTVCAMPAFGDDSFDIILDGSCLHCLIDGERAACLGEVRRLLRPGGVFIVGSMCGLPKSDEAKARFDARTCHLLEDGKPARTLKPAADLAREVSDAGFVVQASRITTNPWWDHVVMTCKATDDQAA